MLNLVYDLWNNFLLSCNHTEEKFVTILIISASIILLLWLLNFRSSKNNEIPPLPPGPRGLPVLGYLPFLSTDLHKSFTELASIYGPIYKLQLGKKLCMVISSPSLAKQVVRDQDVTFANRDPPIVSRIVTWDGNDIAWSSYGPIWKKLRKVFVREMLSNSSIDSLYYLRKLEVKKTIRNIYSKIGEPINIGELSGVTNLNLVMSMVWGGTLEEAGDSVAAEFSHLAHELMVLQGIPNVSDLFPGLGMLDLQGMKKKAEKILNRFENFISPIIERGQNLVEANEINVDQKKSDFLQLLLELKQNEIAEKSLSINEIKGVLIDIVFGGTDTTATMVEWVMAELMKNQEIMEKVHQELNEVVGLNNCVEEFHLPKLCYLDAVVKETFRLHPALPTLVPHVPSQTSTLDGFTIPKGTQVFLNVYAIHRDPNLWENPSEFKPERFMSYNADKFDYSGNNFQFMPFGSGRRVCPGLPLAEKMLKYQLASLVHLFEWNSPNHTELELSDKFGIVVRKLKPLVAIPKPRLSNLDLYV